MELNWVDGFEITVHIEDGTSVISANREGLLSLANHLRGSRRSRRERISIWMLITVWKKVLRN